MTTPIDDPLDSEVVYFSLTLHPFERDDHWMARVLETGVIGVGLSREQAESAAGGASQAIVARIKARLGRSGAEEYLRAHGIRYSLDGEWYRGSGLDTRNLAA